MQRISPKLLILVVAGGAIGAVARWQLDQIINADLASLMLINLSGSLLIGFAAGSSTSVAMRSFFQIGFLGSFTSMSAVIVLLSSNLTSVNLILLTLATFVLAPFLASQGQKVAGGQR